MPKYMFHGSYTQAGVEGLLREGGSGRREALASAVQQAGGQMEGVYFAFGGDDVFVIADLPGHAAAVAFSLQVSASGAFNIQTIVLVTPETVDEAVKKNVSYRPPGG